MNQAGRFAIFATAIAGNTRSVTNSQPILLRINPTRNLTGAIVLPVALSVPLVVLGGGGALLWQRRRLAER